MSLRFFPDSLCKTEPTKIEFGGKGANLISMSSTGINVPFGAVISTDDCIGYLNNEIVLDDLKSYIDKIKDRFINDLGFFPLVSVRSGARVSMPGMMDTILNVGITDENLPLWIDRLGERAAYDSYRRLIQMFGSVASGVPMDEFDAVLSKYKTKEDGSKCSDSEIPVEDLVSVVEEYKNVFHDNTGSYFPNAIEYQLLLAITAVFDSWNNERAIAYRDMHGYSHDWGTAVTVQRMVFGNLNDSSATGVLFTRCPSTGAKVLTGEFLINAQGEDVVAGIRTPEPISFMKEWNQQLFDELKNTADKLESFYGDMQDIEFTIEDGSLFILQTRSAKRSAKARLVTALDLYSEGHMERSVLRETITTDTFRTVLMDQVDPEYKEPPTYTGIAAGGSIVSGIAVSPSHDFSDNEGSVVLVSFETTPEDIVSIGKSAGILTVTGGLTSHAAVVARGMDKTCVVGCSEIVPSDLYGKLVTIDGSTGRVWVSQEVPTVPGGLPTSVLSFIESRILGGNTPVIPDFDINCKSVWLSASGYDLVSSSWIPKFIKDIDDLCMDDRTVYLDMNNPYFGDSNIFDTISGSSYVDYQSYIESAMYCLSSQVSNKDKVIIYADNSYLSKLAKSYDFKTLTEAKDVSSLLSDASECIVTDDSIKRIFGDRSSYDRVIKALEETGTKITTMNKGVSVLGALYRFISN